MSTKPHIEKTIKCLQIKLDDYKDRIVSIERVIRLLREFYPEEKQTTPRQKRKVARTPKTQSGESRKLPRNIYKRGNKYEVMISVNSKLQHVGIFDTLNQAIEAKESFKRKLELEKNKGKTETYYECDNCHIETITKPRECIQCKGEKFTFKSR